MSHCSPLGEAAAVAVKVENMEEITVSLELEHAFKENPAASDGGRSGRRCFGQCEATDVLLRVIDHHNR
jgi:hypothetical protein